MTENRRAGQKEAEGKRARERERESICNRSIFLLAVARVTRERNSLLLMHTPPHVSVCVPVGHTIVDVPFADDTGRETRCVTFTLSVSLSLSLCTPGTACD